MEQFRGYTVYESRGAWVGDDGKTYHDESWQYTIVMQELEVGKLIRWLEKAKDLLRKEAMWLEVSDVNTTVAEEEGESGDIYHALWR